MSLIVVMVPVQQNSSRDQPCLFPFWVYLNFSDRKMISFQEITMQFNKLESRLHLMPIVNRENVVCCIEEYSTIFLW